MSLGLLDGLCPIAPEGFLGVTGCFVATWEIPVLLLVVAAIGGAWWFFSRGGWEDDRSLLILPMGGSPASGGGGGLAWESDEEYQRQRADLRRALSPIDIQSPPQPTSELPRLETPSPPPDPTDRVVLPAAATNSLGRADPAVESVPPLAPNFEGTLQFVPGRLEVVSGPGSGEEMRFVRVPGANQEVTLGRIEGPPHQHLRLNSPTVSRSHARLVYGDGRWRLRNESSTNPTVHNGQILSSMLEEVPLHDGDQIEVGEVTLVFHGGTAPAGLPQRSSWYTDRGRRSANQDAVVVRTLPDGRELVAVCDGMGSHAEGGVASHIALEALVAALSREFQLVQAVEQANDAVLTAAAAAPEREGMATTLVAMLRNRDHYEIANVGDSRAYRLCGGEIEQVTQDHSFVAEAVEAGRMSREEAIQSPWKTAVTRSLGGDTNVDVDVFRGFDATEPAVVLLCTDGVHGVLESDDIRNLAGQSPDIRDLARTIAEEALLRGGEDNVAAAALRFGARAGPGAGNG